MHTLVEHPWLHGAPMHLSGAERRLQRSTAPEMPAGHALYFADGASRRRDDGALASYGCILMIDDQLVARKGVYLGSETNNVAEYRGALEVLEHLLRFKFRRSRIRLDSKLVVNQLN
eukprot:4476420-Karenia_brevis.AAC.1